MKLRWCCADGTGGEARHRRRPRRALGAPRTRDTGGRFAKSFVELSMAGHSRGVRVFKVAKPDKLRHDLHVQASFHLPPRLRRGAQPPQSLVRGPRRACFRPLAHGRWWQKGKSSRISPSPPHFTFTAAFHLLLSSLTPLFAGLCSWAPPHR